MFAVLCGPPAAGAAAAEESAGITREQADAILEELREVRRLLERMVEDDVNPARMPLPDSNVRVSIAGRPAIGAPDAPVTVVEFTDYECPFCRRFHQSTFASLKRDYVETGKVRWVVRDLPLAMHPNARAAAQAAHCAGEQGKFWEMRDVLFARAPASDQAAFRDHGAGLVLDIQSYHACLESTRHLADIDKDQADANGVRITGTPTFVVGPSSGEWVEGQRIVGAQSYAVFDGAIRLQLRAAGSADE